MDTATATATGMKNRPFRISVTCGLVISCISGTTIAQDAQTALDARAFVVKPRISMTETWSDNVLIRSNPNGKESGFITDISPGIRIDAKTARLKAYFDYAFHEQIYTASSAPNRSQNSLNTFGSLEAVSNWLFLDFSGLIAQQAISAFGPQSPSNGNISNNSTETSSYRISPYIKGRFAGVAEYSLRYNWTTTQSNVSTAKNTEISDWAGQLSGSTPFQNLKWSVDATEQNATYSQGNTTEARRLNAMATYSIVPQFRVSASGGSESNNYASPNMVSHTTHGYGFDWTPTERTQISMFKEHRFFGEGHRYSFSHRFPLSSVRYSDTKDISVLPNQFTTIGIGTVSDFLYPLYYQICAQNPQISSKYPDLDTCAKAGLSQLPISPNAQVTSSFLRSQATLQRMQQLAMAFQGARNSLTVMFTRSENQTMLAFNAINDDFSQNNTSSIRQQGASVTLTHQLIGLTNVSLMASRQKSTGSGTNTLKATTSMYQASLSSPLGPKTTGNVSIRHTEFDSSTTPYTENAIVGTLSYIF